MKSIFTIILCLLAVSGSAQSFEELIGDAGRLYDEKNYSESAKAYEKALNQKEGTAGIYYNAACSWALTGDTINALNYLKRSAEKGWTNAQHLQRDSDLTSLHTVKGWNEVVQKVQANLAEYEKDFDQPLKAQLEKIYVRDQTLRQLYQTAEEKFGRESEEMNYFWDLVAQQDSMNELEVIQILEEKGWPGKSEVGGKANTTIWLVIQHAPIEIQEKYLPLLKASVLKGESQGSHLAMLEDRIQMRNGKPQTYGSQITMDSETGKQVVYEIAEPEYVNQRRREVGLGPIEDYVKNWGIVWTIEQKER